MIRALCALACLLLVAGTVECSAETVEVSATIYPMSLALKDVGKEQINVFTIAEPGSDPHSSALLPSAVKTISKGRSIFSFSGVEMNDALERIGPPLSIFGSTSHAWLNVADIAGGSSTSLLDQIAARLCELSPVACSAFKSNAVTSREEIAAVIAKCDLPVQGVTVIVTHPSWGSFLGSVGFKEVTPLFNKRSETVLPQALIEAKQRAEKADKVLFVADPDTEDGLKTVMKEDMHAQVLVLDETGAGALSLADFYLRLCRSIREGLHGI